MNPYTLQTELKRGQRIMFRPRFQSKVFEGTVVAINESSTDTKVKNVYVSYKDIRNWKTVTLHQWVRPHRIFHIIS